jgi:hypothetical protein
MRNCAVMTSQDLGARKVFQNVVQDDAGVMSCNCQYSVLLIELDI